MTTRTLTLNPDNFFHARPAAKIAGTASSYESVIMVILGTETADAKDALSLMRLGHPGSTPVDILADGPDETDALQGVAEVIREEFLLV